MGTTYIKYVLEFNERYPIGNHGMIVLRPSCLDRSSE